MLQLRLRAVRAVAILAATLAISGCSLVRIFTWDPPGEHRRRAEQLRAEGKAEEAIQEYLLHIDERLADEGRPEEENPHFYYIFIGDIYLDAGDVSKALGAYSSAQQLGVYEEFIIDRFRQVARFYEDRGELQKAIEFLSAHRALDIDLFDADIDRLHKKIVAQEEAAPAVRNPPQSHRSLPAAPELLGDSPRGL